MAKYVYKIDFNDGDGLQEFIPDKDAVYEWKPIDTNSSIKRKVVESLVISKNYDSTPDFGSATPLINGDIFDTLWEYYFDVDKQTTEIDLKIYKNEVVDWEGIFYIADGDIDVNTGVYVMSITPDDDYRELLEVADNDINIITGGGVDVWWLLNHLWEESYGVWWSSYNIPVFDSPSITPTVPTKVGNYYRYACTNPVVVVPPFPNCYLLTESIQYILDTILVGTSIEGITLYSEFFSSAFNYVTGTANLLPYTYLAQNSDVKDPDATDKATLGEISFNSLMNDLKAMFKVSWYIDSSPTGSKRLRIEHEKWFYLGLATSGYKTVCINLTDVSKYKDDGGDEYYIVDKLKFMSSDVSKVKSEFIKFAYDGVDDFSNSLNYIEYDVIKTETGNKSNVVENFSTDLTEPINTPESMSDDGFFMFNCGSSGWLLSNEHECGESFRIANNAFSPKRLLHDYYTYGMQTKNAELVVEGDFCPSNQYEVLGTKPIYIQKDITFLLNEADNIDINQYISTYLVKNNGNRVVIKGTIIDIRHDLHDDFVTATLGFEL